MANEDNYWLRRATSGRFTRRRFVGGAAASGLGAAALGLVGCGDDDDDDTTATATGTSTGTAAATGTASGTATASATTAVAKQKGGIARFTSANATYDTFDADRTRFGPMGTLLGLAYQSMVGWKSYKDSKLEGYFTESWQQPDKNVYVFKVRPGTTWHNKAPVNGRAATAADLKFHIERNKAGKLKDGSVDANFYRQPSFRRSSTRWKRSTTRRCALRSRSRRRSS
ncbi:MAG: hypothetical protein IT303_12560 [Dehalococcoidia bacterium]|nr:hypothetical protein [Dehalococcoidia bacterium]